MIPHQPWTLVGSEADRLLPFRASMLLDDLRNRTGTALVLALGDPRALHATLYAGLTPIDHPEFAGHYRDSEHPSLRNRAAAFAFSAEHGTRLLITPSSVSAYMGTYAKLIAQAIDAHQPPSRRAIEGLAAIMIVLGKIHPFLDGNGHIQRITFQAAAERMGYHLVGWSIHPKPYGANVDRLKADGDARALADALTVYLNRV